VHTKFQIDWLAPIVTCLVPHFSDQSYATAVSYIVYGVICMILRLAV